jgi:indole-3-glycerol phosphate synthase
MTTLLEVHDVNHLLQAVNIVGFPHASYSLLGINNRDLRTMRTRIEHCMRLAEMLEDTSVLVAESGIRTPDDLRRLREHGIHIALVGEHLMRQPDPGLALRELLS